MSITKAFIFFIMISILLMVLHFVVISFLTDNDIPVLYNMYGFAYLVGLPVFTVYLFVQTKYADYLGYVYLFLNGLKAIVSIVWILYLIDLLELNIQHTFIHFMLITCFFTLAEFVPLLKLIESNEELKG